MGSASEPFRSLVAELKARRGLLVGAIVATSLAQVAGIPLALLTRRLVTATAADGSAARSIWLGTGLVALVVVQSVCRWVGERRAERLAQATIAGVRVRMVEAVVRRDLRWQGRNALGKSMLRFVGDAAGLRAWVTRTVVQTPADVTTVVFALVALAMLHPLFAVAALVPLMFVPLAAVAVRDGIRDGTRTVRGEQTHLAGELGAVLDDLAAARALGLEDRVAAGPIESVRRVEQGWNRRYRWDLVVKVVATGASGLAICAIGVLGAERVQAGAVEVADVLVGIWLSLLLRGPVRRLATASAVHQRARVSGERIEALLGRERRPNADGEPYSGEEMRVRWKRLGVRDHRGGWVFRGVTGAFTGPGMLEVVGTAAQRQAWFECMLALRRPHEGRVALDRRNVRKLALDDLRRRIGWVDRARSVVRVARSRGLSVDAGWERAPLPSADLALADALARPPGSDAIVDLRLALACALRLDPAVLLVDDPWRGVTEGQIEEVRQLLRGLARHRLVLVGSDVPGSTTPADGTLDLRGGQVARSAGSTATASDRTEEVER